MFTMLRRWRHAARYRAHINTNYAVAKIAFGKVFAIFYNATRLQIRALRRCCGYDKPPAGLL